MNDTLYVILNGSLNMSPGKAAAQATHAAMMLESKHRKAFVANYRRSVIVLEAKNREQLDGIADYLVAAGIAFEYYIDEGVNEVDAFSMTALAVEPFHSDLDPRREIFTGLELYGAEEKEDEYEGNYCESETTTLSRNVYELRRQLGELGMKVVKMEQPKSKWYDRFKRKAPAYGFVS
jgi:peptidyl-tRNA hydrolase